MRIIACVNDSQDTVRQAAGGAEMIFMSSGGAVAAKARDFLPDFIVIDAVMAVVDAIGVLEALPELHLEKQPAVIVLVAQGMEWLARRLTSLGARAVLAKPVTAQAVREVIDQTYFREDIAIGEKTRAVLDEFGIRRSIAGYACLVSAVSIAAGDISALEAVRQRIYEPVAIKCSSTPTRVERTMRFAIESAMSRARVDVVQKMFGYTLREGTGKPTNSEFIARAAFLVRM